MSEKDLSPLKDVSPQTKEALANPNIPHIRFDSLSIEPRVQLVSDKVEQDYIMVLLKDDKATATLKIDMENLES